MRKGKTPLLSKLHGGTGSAPLLPEGALSRGYGQAVGHLGALVHHAVHYPQACRGGLCHEPKGSTVNCNGMGGMRSR